MEWELNKTRWSLTDETKDYWNKSVGFVDFDPKYPDTFDAYKSYHGRQGKGHGPNHLGRFKTLEDAKAAVENSIKV